MHQLIQLKQRTSVFLVAIGLACFGLLPAGQAISPPPDGGYANFTTAEGDHALFSLTSGLANTAVGWYSLSSNTTGSYNTGVGAGALDVNNGSENTATGTGALLLNTTGGSNTANGAFALIFNTTGNNNAAVGNRALEHNTASGNTAVGSEALESNTTGALNTAVGAATLVTNTTGSDNTGVGLNALFSNTTGGMNTAVGRAAMGANTSGGNNTAVGWFALVANTTGAENTAVGDQALSSNTIGQANTAIGPGALPSVTTGNLNTAIGSGAGSNVVTAGGVTCIGANIVGADVSNTCFIGYIRGVTTQNNDAMPVLVDSNNQLGTVNSSRRYKTDIKPMDKASESILALKPVSFRYQVHKDAKPQYGLIAEDVAEVNPNLVIYDADGKPYTVRYDAVNAMLLNEFLKEHNAFVDEQRKVQEQGGTIARLEKQIEKLTAGLQKVSAQVELSKAAPQTVLNNP